MAAQRDRRELEVIEAFLGRLKGKFWTRRLQEAAIATATTTSAWGAGVLVGVWILPASWWLAAAAWLMLLVGIGWVGWRALLQRPVGGLRDVAREAEKLDPSLRNDLVTALQFGSQPEPSDGSSAALIRAHLQEATRQVARHLPNLDALVPKQPTDRLIKWGAGLGCGALIGVWLLGAGNVGTWLSGGANPLINPSSDGLTEDDTPTSLVLGLELNLIPPAYTGEKPKRMRNTSGHLENVLRGTQIELKGTLKVPSELARLIVEDENGDLLDQIDLSLSENGAQFTASFIAKATGHYRFELTQPSGKIAKNDVPRVLSVSEDPAPSVTIKRVEIRPSRQTNPSSIKGPHSVISSGELTLSIDALDERRLTEVALRVTHEGQPAERRVIALSNDLKEHFQTDLRISIASLKQADGSSPLDLQDADTITLTIEALDNDQVSGPKLSKSDTISLRLVSLEDEHEALLAREQEIFDALLLLLADYLTNPILSDEPGQAAQDASPDQPADTAPNIHQKAKDISDSRAKLLEGFAQLIGAISKDSLMLKRDVQLITSLYERLYKLHRDDTRLIEALSTAIHRADPVTSHLLSLGTHRIEQVKHTENTLVRLEELIASQWMDAMQMTAQKIRELSAELKEKLQRYKEAQDPALKAEIMKDIQRLKRKMDELNARLSRQVQQMPQEFMNAEAFKDSAQQSAADLSKDISDLSDMLEQGDIDGLLDALSKMEQDLDKMIAMVDQNASGGSGGGPSPMDEKANQLMDAINNLVGAQSKLEQDSAKVARATQDAQNALQKDALDPLLKQQSERVAAIQDRLQRTQDRPGLTPSDRAAIADLQRRAQTMQSAIDSKDLDSLQSQATQMEEASRDSRYQMLGSDQAFPSDPSSMESFERALSDLSSTEADARAISEALAEGLNGLPTPSLSGDQQGQLDEFALRQRELRARADDFQGMLDQAAEEFPVFKDQMQPSLDQAKNMMGEAAVKLEGHEPQPGLESERQALRALHAMKRQLQQSVQKERMDQEGQGQSPAPEKVAIPEADKRLHRLRQDVLDAMKQQGIQSFDGENNLYYRSLVE